MKNKSRLLVGLLILSLASALAGTVVIYKFLPKYLFQSVYIVHESGIGGESELTKIEENTQYTEYFYPTEPYLKSIVLHMGSTGEEPRNLDRNMTVNMKLLRDDGKVLAQSNLPLEAVGGLAYQEFSLESWVGVGKEYRALITFPERSDLHITASKEEIGPEEHSALLINGEKSEETLYMQYLYGTYSKKLLMLWFLVFFVGIFMIGEYGIYRIKEMGR